MAMDHSYSEEGEWIYCKTSTGLESAGSQERKVAANLEKNSFGGSSTTTTTTTTTTTKPPTTNCLYVTAISNSLGND